MTIALLLIVFFMIEGISKVVFALTIRPFPNWSWVLASGLVGILLVLILWADLPVTALWLVGVLDRADRLAQVAKRRPKLERLGRPRSDQKVSAPPPQAPSHPA